MPMMISTRPASALSGLLQRLNPRTRLRKCSMNSAVPRNGSARPSEYTARYNMPVSALAWVELSASMAPSIGPMQGVQPTAKAMPSKKAAVGRPPSSVCPRRPVPLQRRHAPPAQHEQAHQHDQQARHQIGFLPVGHQPLPQKTGACAQRHENHAEPEDKTAAQPQGFQAA